MKRILTLVLLGFFVFSLSACNTLSDEDNFNEAFENMEDLNNATMEMTITMELFGEEIEITATAKYDGNFMEMSMLGSTELQYIYEGYTFFMTDFDGVNAVVIDYGALNEVSDDDMFGLPEIDDLVFGDFTVTDDLYTYNGDVDELGVFTLKIENGLISEMHFLIEESGMEMALEVEFSDYGTTSISGKPSISNVETYIDLLIELHELGYLVSYEGDQISIHSLDGFGLNFYSESNIAYGSMEFNPVDDTIWHYDGEDEGFFSFDEYYNGLADTALDRDDLEVIDDFLDAMIALD